MDDKISEPIVSMRGVRKSFDHVEVLHGVDFELHEGKVHALVGGNGAGKSTLMKILQGVHRPDAGRVYVKGRPVSFESPKEATAAGIGMVFQEFSLMSNLSVAQNILLGREPRRFGLIDDRALVRQAAEILGTMDIELDPTTNLGELSVGFWQLTEIAKALSLQAEVLVMDEPTASLPQHESEQLFALIDRLKDRGLSIVYISHRMPEIARVADRITVLREGERVFTDDVAATTPDKVVEAIVGRKIHQGLTRERRDVTRQGTPLLHARNLQAGQRVNDVSFRLYPGEILGLAGLMGSGRTELARCLFGVDRLEAGEIMLRDRPLRLRSPAAAIEAGIMLVPEDRQRQGLVLNHAVQDNLLLPSLGRLCRGPIVDDRRGRGLVIELVERLGIQAASLARPVRLLSGGNQQKVVIAKWLGLKQTGHGLDVLILDEPTAGVDIDTKTEIMHLIGELADAGTGVIVISSELEELLAVCDRVLVVRDGWISDELAREEIADEESLQLTIQGV
jgi:ribose transport system ATP-binding protein